MDNLPVSWCIQVAGSPEVLQAVNASFPVEVLVDKIKLLDRGNGANVTQVSPVSPRTNMMGELCP